jgi:hypothetical protein
MLGNILFCAGDKVDWLYLEVKPNSFYDKAELHVNGKVFKSSIAFAKVHILVKKYSVCFDLDDDTIAILRKFTHMYSLIVLTLDQLQMIQQLPCSLDFSQSSIYHAGNTLTVIHKHDIFYISPTSITYIGNCRRMSLVNGNITYDSHPDENTMYVTAVSYNFLRIVDGSAILTYSQ